jgi:Zn-finger nucleic acid-binding protein
MVEQDFGDVRVDVCMNGCKGIWFDWQELRRLDENHEGVGKMLEAALKSSRVNDAGREPLTCPKCGIAMHAHKYGNAKEVNVDECYACGGFFLDSGELRVIRDSYMSEQERDAYVQKLVGGAPVVGDSAKAKLRRSACYRFASILNTKLLWFPTAPIPQKWFEGLFGKL